MATTTNYAWTKPTVGADNGTWGTTLNSTLDSIDTNLKTVDTAQVASAAVAAAALPKAGGTMTGHITGLTASTPSTDLASATGAVTVNTALGQHFKHTIAGAVVYTFSNPPTTGKAFGFVLQLTNPGAASLTFPAGVKWPGGSPPSWTASGVDVVVFTTIDAGTTWRAARVMADSR
jgi:hypothetical protein